MQTSLACWLLLVPAALGFGPLRWGPPCAATKRGSRCSSPPTPLSRHGVMLEAKRPTMESSLAALGLEKSATADEAKRAYRKAAMRCHPDRNSTEAAAEEFQRISDAYAFVAGKGDGEEAEAVIDALADLTKEFAFFARDVFKVR